MSCEMKELFCCINENIHSKFLQSRLCPDCCYKCPLSLSNVLYILMPFMYK